MKLIIKPLSVNEIYTGRRFKTKTGKAYRAHLVAILPAKLPDNLPERFCVACRWGVSNDSADFDNPCKAFIDALQYRYGFNDKHIMQGLLEKTVVPKGEEFIEYFFYSEKLDFDLLKGVIGL